MDARIYATLRLIRFVYIYISFCHGDGDGSSSVILLGLSLFQTAWYHIPEKCHLDTYYANLKSYIETNNSGKI
jgi:hypothetical protein